MWHAGQQKISAPKLALYVRNSCHAIEKVNYMNENQTHMPMTGKDVNKRI